MANVVEMQVPLRDELGGISTFSHSEYEIKLKLIGVGLLEFEDVLFHFDSAVMMPENPGGKSSRDGSEDDARDKDDQLIKKEQKITTGIKALALVFKELELDPDKRILIAAHTDTSGRDEYNFKLSGWRAENVFYLLTGDRDSWAQNCYDQHRVEDYQQIMTYYSSLPGALLYDFYLEKIDNVWGPKTEKATRSFISFYNTEFIKDKPGLSPIAENPDDLIAGIKRDNHRWPRILWKAAFDLYSDELGKIFNVKPRKDEPPEKIYEAQKARLDQLRTALKEKFLYPDLPYVACGESFPIDDSEKTNYRSQANRRVEALFFDKNEALDIIYFETCSDPKKKQKKHLEEECPLWNKKHFRQLYIDPKDLYSVVYHLRFVYFNQVLNKLMNVPTGLTIEVFQNGSESVPAQTVYKNGIYCVKAQFPTPLDDSRRTSIHFEFKTEDLWIYTKDSSSTPEFVKKTKDEMDLEPREKRLKHFYDMPKQWTSKHYTVRYEGTDKDIMEGKDKRTYFTWLLLDLPDTPRLKPFGNYATSVEKPMTFSFDDIILTDENYLPAGTAAQEGALLDENFVVIRPDTSNDKSYYTIDGIPGDIIPFSGTFIRGVVVDERLYVVFKDRITTGAYAGYRAAVYLHKEKCACIPVFYQYHYRDFHQIGNFDAYFLRELDFDPKKNEVIGYIFNYFRWHFRDKPGSHPAKPIDQKWKDIAARNFVWEWNRHDILKNTDRLGSLFYDDKTEKTKYRIYIRYYIESIPAGTEHTIINVHPVESKKARSSMGRDEGNIRADENVRQADGFVGAHEFGHAGSLDDDYVEKWYECCYYQPGFVEFKEGAPFYHDDDSLMCSNKKIRARHYWHFAEWMNKQFSPGKLTPFCVQMADEPDYELPTKNKNLWKPGDSLMMGNHYLNFPDISMSSTYNTLNKKGMFSVYLYPLGKDAYSQGANSDGTGYEHALCKGKKFTAVLVVKVNLYFKFQYSAGYQGIIDLLDKVNVSIEDNFSKNQTVKICGKAPYEETYVQVQARYLVDNYTAEYSKNLNEDLTTKQKYEDHRDSILNKPESKPHFIIKVIDPVWGTVFTDTKWDNPTTLTLVKGDGEDFWEYFAEMLGLKRGGKLTKDNFAVDKIIIDGVVKNV
jgi:hypothetical protein